MKDKISTYVQLYLGTITLNICVEDDLSLKNGNLKNFGWFEVTDSSTYGETFHWDNLPFFNQMTYVQFTAECTKMF